MMTSSIVHYLPQSVKWFGTDFKCLTVERDHPFLVLLVFSFVSKVNKPGETDVMLRRTGHELFGKVFFDFFLLPLSLGVRSCHIMKAFLPEKKEFYNSDINSSLRIEYNRSLVAE